MVSRNEPAAHRGGRRSSELIIFGIENWKREIQLEPNSVRDSHLVPYHGPWKTARKTQPRARQTPSSLFNLGPEVGGETGSVPEALSRVGAIAQSARVELAYGALGLDAWFRMDHGLHHALQLIFENAPQLHDFRVCDIETQLTRQNEVKIEKEPISGSPGPKSMNVDPRLPAVVIDQATNIIQETGIGGIHQPRIGMAHELDSREDDEHRHGTGYGAVQPKQAGLLDHEQTEQDTHRGINVGQDVFAVSCENEGMTSLAHMDEYKPQAEIHDAGEEQETQPRLEVWDAMGGHELMISLMDNPQRRNEDEPALESR
jgi:hypothetical protein